MGILSNTKELKEDVLFRASESIGGSSRFEGDVIRYLNRCYRTLAAGASEFLPEYVDDWWWLRGAGVLILEPTYKTGLVNVTNGSPNITFTVAPTASMTGRRLLIDQQPDAPIIAGHTGGSVNATLDANWTGATASNKAFRILRTVYNLDIAIQVITSPMVCFAQTNRIIGLSPERMDELYPVSLLTFGVPQAFSLDTETQVRFSHGGDDLGTFIRTEYRFRPKITDLTDNTASIPLVPSQWMHILADMALTYLLIDKNDDRSNAVALAARTTLAAMFKENRRRLAKMDSLAGKIITRQDKLVRRPARSFPTL